LGGNFYNLKRHVRFRQLVYRYICMENFAYIMENEGHVFETHKNMNIYQSIHTYINIHTHAHTLFLCHTHTLDLHDTFGTCPNTLFLTHTHTQTHTQTHTHSHTRTQALHDTFGTPPNTFSTPSPAHFKPPPSFSNPTPSLPTPTRFSRSCFFAGVELRPLYATTKYKYSKVSSIVIKNGAFSSELTFSGNFLLSEAARATATMYLPYEF